MYLYYYYYYIHKSELITDYSSQLKYNKTISKPYSTLDKQQNFNEWIKIWCTLKKCVKMAENNDFFFILWHKCFPAKKYIPIFLCMDTWNKNTKKTLKILSLFFECAKISILLCFVVKLGESFWSLKFKIAFLFFYK